MCGMHQFLVYFIFLSNWVGLFISWLSADYTDEYQLIAAGYKSAVKISWLQPTVKSAQDQLRLLVDNQLILNWQSTDILNWLSAILDWWSAGFQLKISWLPAKCQSRVSLDVCWLLRRYTIALKKWKHRDFHNIYYIFLNCELKNNSQDHET